MAKTDPVKKNLSAVPPPDTLTRNDRQKLWSARIGIVTKMRMPSIVFDARKPYRFGDLLTLHIKGCISPVADLVKQTLRYPKNATPGHVFVSFRGVHGPTVARGDYSPTTNELRVAVPADARSGPLVVLMPLIEIGADKIARYRKVSVKNFLEGRIFIVPAITAPFDISCGKCIDPSASLCPHGNIKFDLDGHCYIDQDSCRGKKRDGTTCWECFPPGDSATVSPLCTNNELRKTAYISRVGDDWCCGCCATPFQVIPGRCLKDLCAYDAITGGNSLCDRCPQQTGGVSPHEVDDWGYWIDQIHCMGCMVCYENIRCPKVQMKAFLGEGQRRIVFRELRLQRFHRVPRVDIFKDIIRLGIWYVKDRTYRMSEIPIRLSSKPQRLNIEISSERETHVALFARKGSGPLIPLGFDIRATVTTLAGVQQSRIRMIRFNTIIGPCDLAVEFLPTHIPGARSHGTVINDGMCTEGPPT